MLNRVMEWSVRNKLIIVLVTTAAILGGIWAVSQTPLEALPDLSDVQVIVQADYNEQAPRRPGHLSDCGRDAESPRCCFCSRVFILRRLVRVHHLQGRH